MSQASNATRSATADEMPRAIATIVAAFIADPPARQHPDDLLATFEQMAESHPREAHWYLPQIGVDPAAQGTGIGAALMRHALVTPMVRKPRRQASL